MRIVSLLSSATEIVCRLGLERELVARSHECDFPNRILELPQVTSTKFPVEKTSREIDHSIRELVRMGLAVYEVDADKLQALNPDIVLTQIQCEVCAVSRQDVERAFREWVGDRPKLVTLNPNCLSDIFFDIQQIASACGVPERGEILVSELQEGMRLIQARTQNLPQVLRPRVITLEWLDPLMTGGHWMPDLVRMAGGEILLSESHRNSPRIPWSRILEADPDVLVLAPCGWGIPRIEEELQLLLHNPDWRDSWNRLRAVHTNRVYLADGNQFFNRPGPRILDSLEILSEILHPSQSNSSHFKQRHWISWKM
jgi:iron complex transport system substrate-binding protein